MCNNKREFYDVSKLAYPELVPTYNSCRYCSITNSFSFIAKKSKRTSLPFVYKTFVTIRNKIGGGYRVEFKEFNQYGYVGNTISGEFYIHGQFCNTSV